jgi:hypothetical protein
MEKTWTKFGKVAGVALLSVATAAAAALASVARASVAAASDMAETINKSSVVFGKSAAQVEAFGSKTAKSIGVSKRAAIEAAATYGNLFVGMKIGQKPAADMSTRLVTLAADLASLNNVPVADALDAIRAGLVGESEPLRRFAIDLNDAELRAKAFALGIYDGEGVLTSSQKALAAYNLMLEKSTTATGDASETIGGLAGQQKSLSAMWEDAKAQLGEKLLPVMSEFLSMAIDELPVVVGLIGQVAEAVHKVSGWWIDALTNYEKYYAASATQEEKAERRAAELAAQGVDVSAIQSAKNSLGDDKSLGGLEYLWTGGKGGGPSGEANKFRRITFPVGVELDEKQIQSTAWQMAFEYVQETGDELTDTANREQMASWLEYLYKSDPTKAAETAAQLYLAAVRRNLAGGVGSIFNWGGGGTPSGSGTSTTPTHDAGGFLPPGMSIAVNKTGKPEPVLNPAQAGQLLNMGPVLDALERQLGSLGQNIGQLASAQGGGGPQIIQVLDSSSIDKAREHGGRFARI